MVSKKKVHQSKPGQSRGKAKKIKPKNELKGKPTEVLYHSTKEIKVERALIENFIGLQKVMVELSGKFDSLSSQISSLLQLFEMSAKTLARKEASSSSGLDAKKVLEKLDRLTAQAGLIGKGLALIHEVGTEERKSLMSSQGQMRPSVMHSSPPANLKPAVPRMPVNTQLPRLPTNQSNDKPMTMEADTEKKADAKLP